VIGFDLRLVAYAPNGARLGVLPTPLSVDLGVPLDDVPSLRLNYPLGAPGAAALAGPVEVAVETMNPATGGWAEVDGARFLRIKRSGDIVDPTGARSYELPGYVWMLCKARLFPSASDNSDGKRPFLSATPGTILATLVNEAKARGALPGLGVDFTPSVDSAGAAWSKVLTIYYEPGIDIATVLDNLAEQGVLDWATRGRTLRVFNPDTVLGRDLAVGAAPVDLRLGRDITEAPDTGTLEDVASAVFTQGEGTARLEVTNPNAPTPWGRWESFITQGGVNDEGTMRLLAEAELDRTGRERVQITRGLDFTAAKWLPFRDYRHGDYVLAPGDTGTLESLRVRQITLTRNQAGKFAGNLVLNDRFLERDLRLAKRTAGIVGGATATGGSGARPAPDGPDTRAPAAPAGLIVETTAYLDSDGAARGQITATWGTVDTAEDGTAIEVERYELYQRPNVVGLPWSSLTTTQDPDHSATASPYDVGTQWAFKVRAISRAGVTGAWSDPYAVTIARDATPPPTPSAPTLTTRLGVIHADWDGKGAAGEVMPADFGHLDVWMQATSDAPIWSETWPTTEGSLDLNTWTVLQSGTNGDPDYTVTGGRLTINSGSDLLAARDVGSRDYTVTGHDIACGTDYRAGVYARYSPGPSPRWPYGERGIYVLAHKADTGNNIRFYVDAPDSRMVELPLPAGSTVDRITLALKVTGRTVEVFADNVSVHTDTLTADEDAALRGTAAAVYLEWPHASIGQLTVAPPTAAPPARVGQLEGAGGIVVTDQPYNQPRTLWFRAFDRSGNASAESARSTITTQPLVGGDMVGKIISSDKILANSITADVIAVGAVTASAIRVEAVTADALSADAIDGKTITGATVRTSASNPRVQLDEDGLHAWNSAGVNTVEVSSATGSATITGRFQTSTSGKRVRIEPEISTGRPGILFETGSANFPAPPSIFTDSDSSSQSGVLWMSSAERVLNQTGRSELLLFPNGRWSLSGDTKDPGTSTQIRSDADGRLWFTGSVPTGGVSETMMFGGANGFSNASGATLSYARVNPNSIFNVVVTCASPTGPAVRWAITNRSPNSFSVGWVDTNQMILQWLVFRNQG
jgi:hypothetical protein